MVAASAVPFARGSKSTGVWNNTNLHRCPMEGIGMRARKARSPEVARGCQGSSGSCFAPITRILAEPLPERWVELILSLNERERLAGKKIAMRILLQLRKARSVTAASRFVAPSSLTF